MRRNLAPGLVCSLLGFMLVLQVRTLTVKEAQAMKQAQSTDEMIIQLIQTSKETDRLQEELRVLKGMATQEASRSRLQQQVRQERAASGLAPVAGRGVIITLADARSATQIMVKDVLLVINELRASGAEAMAVGSLRVTERMSVAPASGGGVAIGGEPVREPLVISAVGDPDVLAAGLNMRGGVLQEPRQYYPVTVMAAPEILIPPADAQPDRYARPNR